MARKPNRAADYDSRQVESVRATCLYIATKLGDLIDETVIVGGLVPSLLVEHGSVDSGEARHVGTMDLDVGLAVAIFDNQRYQELAARLRQAGFTPDSSVGGPPTRQRWKIVAEATVTVDFLMAPNASDDPRTRLRDIESDFAAILAPGLHLAFADRELVGLEGRTIKGEVARRDVWVAGPGAFVILKALALRGRGENKDAYDLYYLLRNLVAGADEIVRRLSPLADDASVRKGLEVLEEAFAEIDSVGPRRVAEFLLGGPDDALQADVRGVVLDFLDLMRVRKPSNP